MSPRQDKGVASSLPVAQCCGTAMSSQQSEPKELHQSIAGQLVTGCAINTQTLPVIVHIRITLVSYAAATKE